ncbi:hypothetical protein AX16_004610 [Volvariella volvacea WC 439]|nr:hypothetical protein AX16_004610 [Volvariella volvacea WC 439]
MPFLSVTNALSAPLAPLTAHNTPAIQPVTGDKFVTQAPKHDTSMDLPTKDSTMTLEPSPVKLTYTRDTTYYREDGDCVLLVGQVLFKVHRFLLAQDSSTFGTMVHNPQPPGGGPRRGSSDDDPITLTDDADEFRTLCWALYALAHEIGAQYDSKRVDIPKIISLVRICGKYSFSSLEKWSLDVLETHLNTQSTCTFTDSCSADDLACILERSVLGQIKNLENFVEDKWLYRIQKGEFDVAYALNVAERLDLRQFQGFLYYVQATKLSSLLHPRQFTSAVPVVFNVREELSKSALTLDQQMKLTSGICSLTLSWLNLLGTMTAPPVHATTYIEDDDDIDDDDDEGGYQELCSSQTWEFIFQKSLSSNSFTVDCLDNIDQIVEMLEKNPVCRAEFQKLCSSCQAQVKKQLTDVKARLQASIPDHFLGTVDH